MTIVSQSLLVERAVGGRAVKGHCLTAAEPKQVGHESRKFEVENIAPLIPPFGHCYRDVIDGRPKKRVYPG